MKYTIMKKNVLFAILFSLFSTTVPTTTKAVIAKKTFFTAAGSIIAAIGGAGMWYSNSQINNYGKKLASLKTALHKLKKLNQSLTEKELEKKEKIIDIIKKLLESKKITQNSIFEKEKFLTNKQNFYKKFQFISGYIIFIGIIVALKSYLYKSPFDNEYAPSVYSSPYSSYGNNHDQTDSSSNTFFTYKPKNDSSLYSSSEDRYQKENSVVEELKNKFVKWSETSTLFDIDESQCGFDTDNESPCEFE